jgi:tRNA-specific adenosine deaminase 1
MLISPERAYIKTLVLPRSQHVPIAVQRAFSRNGRLCVLQPDITASWAGGLVFSPFNVDSTALEFSYSRRNFSYEHSLIASNISAIYSPLFQETLVGGVLQGRKPSDPRGASIVSRRNMWNAVADVRATLRTGESTGIASEVSYSAFKASALLVNRRKVKADVLDIALKGWVRNDGDGDFHLGEV